MADSGSVRFRPVIILFFLILGFALSWYPWVLVLLGYHGNGGPNPLGLFVAALVAAAVDAGWRGPRDLLLGLVRVRVPITLWLAAVLIPFAIVAAAIAVALALGLHVTLVPVPWSDLFDRFVFTFLFVALGEEPGWRGFLLPQLQRGMHPFMATLVVSLIWAFWHLPLMGTEFAWPIVPAFVASVFGGAFFLSWLYNGSRGSILLPMLTHTVVNTIGAGYAFHLVAAADLTKFWDLYAVLWLAAAVVVLVATRGRFGLRPA